jgi:protein involved in polysaccharide export with SLBB domain
MHLRDLLTIAGGALPGANLDEAVLVHQHPDGTFAFQFVNLTQAAKDLPTDNVLVLDRDVLIVRRTDETRFTPEHSITVLGEAVYPGLYPRGEAMHLSDALKLAGWLKPDATNTIRVAHARKDEGAIPLKATFAPAANYPGGGVTPDPTLEDGDIVTIQGRGEFVDKPAVIFIRGAVNRPGPVTLTDPNMRLTEALAAAGGLKSGAYPEGAQFFRSESRLNTDSQKHIEESLTKLNDLLNHAEYERSQAVSEIERLKAVGRAAQPPVPIPGVSSTDGSDPSASIAQQAAGRVLSHELVSQPRSLKPADLQANGNVAIDLPAAIKHPHGVDDLVMVDSDAIDIPETPTTVQVVGAVQFSRGVLYRKGERLDYYISRAGGFAQDAARDRILIIRLGGGLLPIAKAKEFLPGDVLLVPTKVLAAKIASHSNDIDTFFRALTTSTIIFFVAQRLFGF